MVLKRYFESALDLFLSENNLITQNISLAGRNVTLNFSSAELRNQFMPSIEHLTGLHQEDTELTIYVGDGETLKKVLKAPPWPDETFNSQGFANEIEQNEYQIFFQPWLRQVYLFSRKHKIGIYWVKSISEIPWWEKTFSFRIIFHWWTRDLPAQLMHAGAIANNKNEGYLITGASGSGKSTTCLNLVQNGLKYLGDDYIWVELEDSIKVIALYQTAKLEADNFLERFAEWKHFLKNPDTFVQQKAIFDLKEMFPDNWLNEAEIKGIILPQVSGKNDSSIIFSKRKHSLIAIAPTTLHHLPHHRKISYRKISEIVTASNTYMWKLSTQKNNNLVEFERFLTHEENSN